MQRIVAQFYPCSLLIPSPLVYSAFPFYFATFFFYVDSWRRWTVAVLVTQRSLVHVLVMSKCALAEIWTSTVWLAVLVKAEPRFWEVLWHYYSCWVFVFYQTLFSQFPCIGCSSQVIWVALGAGKNKICNVFASVSVGGSLVELGLLVKVFPLDSLDRYRHNANQPF